MTIPLTGAGSYFVRAGHLLGESVANLSTANDPLYYNGTTLAAKITVTEADYAAGTPCQQSIQGLFAALNAQQQAQNSWLSGFSGQAGWVARTLIDMANQDQGYVPPPLGNSQYTLTFAQALDLLISQMGSATASVQRSVPSVGAQASVGSPHGNPIISLAVLGSNGLLLQYVMGETLTFTCSGDSQSGGGTLNAEPLTVTGPVAAPSPLSPQWPGGSGVSGMLTCADATSSNANGNKLVNSDFETYATTPNLPDNWLADTGVIGTNILRGTTAYTGTYSLRLAGTGGTAGGITQQFNLAGGTTATLVAGGVYAVNFVEQVSAVPAAGVLEIALVDGSGTIITDDAGTNNAVSVTLSGSSSTTFTSHQAYFRLPNPPTAMPTTIKLRVRLSTDITSGKSVFVDHLCFSGPVPQLYVGGPYAQAFSMNTYVLKGDQFQIVVSQTWGVFQKNLQRIWDLRTLGRTIPFAASPTVSDALVA